MRVQVTEPTYAGGQQVVPGSVIDLTDREAKFLIAIRKARLPDPAPPAKPEPKAPKGGGK